MRQWRVGSFSMGLVLVLLGVGLLLDRLQGTPAALELIINWWPLALILLGVEILAAGILFRGEKITLKYDFWSVLLVIVFFMFSLTFYGLSAGGVIPLLQEALHSKEHSVSLPEETIDLEEIDRVVLSCSGGALKLRSAEGGDLQIFGRGTVSAVSEEEAAELVQSAQASYSIEGSTLYMQVSDLPYRGSPFGWRGAGEIYRTILVPANVSLDLRRSGGYHQTEVVLDDLAATWSLNVDGAIKATLSPALQATVYGLANHEDLFKGNVDWAAQENTAQKAAATFTLGEGTWPLHISAEWDIEVNTR